jgi:hypothetical protein
MQVVTSSRISVSAEVMAIAWRQWRQCEERHSFEDGRRRMTRLLYRLSCGCDVSHETCGLKGQLQAPERLAGAALAKAACLRPLHRPPEATTRLYTASGRLCLH